jgi:hypothetical protein
MIIGIILLIAGGITVYLLTREEAPREAEIQRLAGELPLAMQPVQTFVQDCIKSTATEAIRQSGTGGYIEAENEQISGRTFNKDETEPTNSDGITSLNGQFIPYWHYMSSSNLCVENCQFSSHKPELAEVEGQINRYVQRELPNCLNDFENFQNLELTSKGEIEISTQIRMDDITITADYPLRFEQDGKTYSLEQFFTNVDFNYHTTYDLAEAILQYETEESYLERNTINWISGFAGIDYNKFPPLFGSDYGCKESVFWIEEEVHINKLNPMLSAYVPSLQPVGVNNQADFGNMNEMQLGLYSQSLILTDASLAEGLTATHTYLDWPTYLKIHTSSGGLLEPNVYTFDIPFYDFCLAEYKFAYDVSYPILIEITDPEAFNGEGYTLQFAVETNVRRNEPMHTFALQGVDAIPPVYAEQSMLCKANQRTSGNITIETFDARTNQPLDDVMVNYCIPDADGVCGDDNCYLGLTKNGKLITQLPPGQGLIMLQKRPDYQRTVAIFGSLAGKKGELKASLEPYRTLNVSVTKKMLKKSCESQYDISALKIAGGLICPLCGIVRAVHGDDAGEVCWWDFDNSDQRQLEQEESAIVMLKRMEPPSYTSFTQQAVLTNQNQTQEIQLIPGRYKIEVMVLTDKQHVIPEDEMCFEDDWYDYLGLGLDECVTLDKVELNGTLLGGVTINTETGGYLDITAQDIENDEIVIYTVSPELSDMTKHDDLKLMGLTANYTTELRKDLLPVFR